MRAWRSKLYIPESTLRRVDETMRDATLYAWRECRAYMTTPKKRQENDSERMARMEAEALAELRGDVDAWED